MNKDDFKIFVEGTLEQVIQLAESKTGKNLSRDIAFKWFSQKTPVVEDISQFITDKVFIDENHIYPCVDIGVFDVLEDGKTLISASVAGFEPRPFEKNWQGEEGPFIHVIGQNFINKYSVSQK